MTSWSSTTSRDGAASCRAAGTARACSAWQARPPKRAWKAAICIVGSPEAVGRNSTRGSRRGASDRMKSSSAGCRGSIVKPPPPMARIVGGRPPLTRPRIRAWGPQGRWWRAGARRSPRRRARPGRRAPSAARRRPGELGAAEVQRGAVVGGVAGQHAVADEAQVLLAALRLGVVVDAVGVRQQAEALHDARRPVEGGQRLAEPAQRAGRQAAQHDAAAPGLGQHLVEAVRAPGAEHAHDVAAADVDHVLLRAGARATSPSTAPLERSRRNSDTWLASVRQAKCR